MILKYLEKVDEEPKEKTNEELKVMYNLVLLTFYDHVPQKFAIHLTLISHNTLNLNFEFM